MSEIVSPIAYRRLRAPREDGGALFDPPLSEEAGWLQQNLARREQFDGDICGRRLSELRTLARQRLVQKADHFTRQYRDVPPRPWHDNAPLILVGHQPELVHPGVLFKNFLLSELAHRTTAHAVNLLIDNDSVRKTSIRVPGGSVDDPIVSSISFDSPSEPIPYEERPVSDMPQFVQFGQRVLETIRPLVPHPLIQRLWPVAIRAAREHGNLGRALAQARHIVEGEWGLSSLELPLSQVCDDRPFRWFSAHLLAEAARLREVHNDCLTEYRRVHKIRGRTHPVPDLTRHDQWTEVPFWLWSVQRPQRRPAFVRRHGSQVVLSDRHQLHTTLTLDPHGDAGSCVEQLEAAHRQGLRLRPRALITTMFARLVLSDIFVHGIGGAKYDQVTDAIVRRFWGIEPPEYLVATATLKLPVARASVDIGDIRRVNQLLRELRYHPEWHVDSTPETRALTAEKRRWVDRQLPAGYRKERHENIERVNQELLSLLQDRQQLLQQERVALRSVLPKQAILHSREYAFCLFPADSLRDRLLDLSRQEP